MKKVVLILAILVGLLLVFAVGSGFLKRGDVALMDYTVSEDGGTLHFRAAVMSSMGHTRGFYETDGPDGSITLTFRNTFGGLNSALGAKEDFRLALAENVTEIRFTDSCGNAVPVLVKDEQSGQWERP